MIFAHFSANRDHNVPDNSLQQSHPVHQSKVPHTRSTSMTVDVVASTSDQAITGISSRKSKQRKSDSSSSSPAMSPSYIQNKQYRTNTPRNVDLIESKCHLKSFFSFRFFHRFGTFHLFENHAIFFLCEVLFFIIAIAFKLCVFFFLIFFPVFLCANFFSSIRCDAFK